MDRRSSLKAALLDFDGTLVDLPVDWERLRTQISLVFADYGVAREFRPLVAGMTQAFAELKARGVPSHTRAGLHRRINRLVTEAEVEAARTAAPLPGSGELLERLRDEGWKTIIQTSNSVRAVETARLRLSWAAVDAVVGRESARRAKPDPQGVRTELRRLGLRGSECVVVGDGDFDVALGRAIGAKTVRVTNGEPPPATSVEADIEICSLKELLGLLDAELEPAGGVA